jgi:hypothetical protein
LVCGGGFINMKIRITLILIKSLKNHHEHILILIMCFCQVPVTSLFKYKQVHRHAPSWASQKQKAV